jgi:hypothetical protein
LLGEEQALFCDIAALILANLGASWPRLEPAG